MNSEIKDIISNLHLHPLSYEKKGKVVIIKDKDKTYVIKHANSNHDIYKYLISRDFRHIPHFLLSKYNDYDIYEYLPSLSVNINQQIEDMLTILSILHKKTMHLREIDLDDIKKIYEDLNQKINESYNFYNQLNDKIDHELFINPCYYFLVRNISLIYKSLEYAKNSLQEWYQKVKDSKSVRISLLHNNIDVEHLIINDNKYLISWDKAYFNNPIYDLEIFYLKYYQEIEFLDMLSIYEKNNKLTNLEYQLLIIKLIIPKIIEFSNNTLNDTKIVYEMISFLKKINYAFYKNFHKS